MPAEPLLPESELRSRVLQRIDDGRLPVVLSTAIRAGYGQGVQCDLCDQPIAVNKFVCVPTGGTSRHERNGYLLSQGSRRHAELTRLDGPDLIARVPRSSPPLTCRQHLEEGHQHEAHYIHISIPLRSRFNSTRAG